MQLLQIRIASVVLLCVCFQSGTVEAQAELVTITDTIPGTDVHFTMVGLRGGTFLMGTPENEDGREEDEGPQRTITVSPFYIGVHEVTYDEFLLFVSVEHDTPEGAPGTNFDPKLIARPSPPYEDPAHGMGTNGYPSVGMTQRSALQYTHWLSIKTGVFYRLPTEAEWEYACRAGTVSAFSFGGTTDSLDHYAWHYGNSDEMYQPVGQKRPNAWGVFDMHGNVAEWTLDEYSTTYYESIEALPSVDPWNLPTRLHPRTVRGGAYDDSPEALRCGARVRSDLDWKRRDPQIPRSMWWNTDSPFVGFRIVRPFLQPSDEGREEFWTKALGG